jgi:hypothetical protein
MSGVTSNQLKGQLVSPIGAKFLNAANPFMPRAPVCTAPFMIDHQLIEPLSGVHGPSGRPVTELPLTINLIKSLQIRLRLGALDVAGTSATFARYVDFIGLTCWEEIRLRYGTNQLQVIRADAIFAKIFSCMEDEQRNKACALLLGALTPAQRSARAAQPQECIIPLYTLLGLHLDADPSQVLAPRALGEKLRIEIVYRSKDYWVETDSLTYKVNTVASTSAAVTDYAIAGECGVLMEGVYLSDQDAAANEQLYRGMLRYVFSDWQHNSSAVLPAATALNGTTFSIPLNDISQPVKALYILCRWSADLDRVAGGTSGTYGCNRYNGKIGGKLFFAINLIVSRFSRLVV